MTREWNGAVLNLLGKRGPGILHCLYAEGVGFVVENLKIIAHSHGSVAFCGLVSVHHLEGHQSREEAGEVFASFIDLQYKDTLFSSLSFRVASSTFTFPLSNLRDSTKYIKQKYLQNKTEVFSPLTE